MTQLDFKSSVTNKFTLFLLIALSFLFYRYFVPEAEFSDRLANIPVVLSPIDNDLYDKEDNAMEWFNPDGFARGLHILNTARIDYFYKVIKTHSSNKQRQSLISVLDVGCGGGIGTEKLFEKDFVKLENYKTSSAVSTSQEPYVSFKLGLNVTGIEPSTNSIHIASSHFQTTRISELLNHESNSVKKPSLRYTVGSAYDLSAYPDESIDVVISSDVMDHLFDLKTAIKEANRVLKNQTGLFIFETINRTYWSFLWVQRLAEWAGLVPHGTHDYRLFVTVDEVRQLVEKHADMTMKEVKGTKVIVGPAIHYKEIDLSFIRPNLKFNVPYLWPAMKQAFISDKDLSVGIIGYAVKN